MSQEIREKALSAAVAVLGETAGIAGVIAAAKEFEAYISNGASAAPKAGKLTTTLTGVSGPSSTAEKSKPATKAADPKPATKPAPKKAEVDPDAKKLVGDKVNELLKANKREEAIALLASFEGAQSATGIVAQGDEVVQAFLTQADEILSAEGSLAD